VRTGFIFTTMTPAYKKLYYTGVPVYLALLVLAGLFYKERAFFSDNAYVVFNLLKDGHLRIYHFRFIEIFAESFSLLAMKLHASLSTILFLYGVSFSLFQFACYLVCGLWLRQYAAGLVLLLVNILFISDSFYWSISELPQAISLLFVLYAYIMSRQERGKIVFYAVCSILIITMAFAHLLVFFPLVYASFFFYLHREQLLSRKILWVIPAAYIIAVVLKTIFFREEYEQHSLGGLKHFITLFPGYFSTYSFQRFFANLGGKFIWITLLTAGIISFYIARREWRQAGLFLVAMCGYIMLANVSFPDADTNDFYIENMYYPLAVFMALPFVFDLLPVLIQRKQAIPVLLLITLMGIVRIWHTHTPYTARLQWQRNFMKENAGKKLLTDASKVPMDTVMMTWATPYEFALLSSAETGHTECFTIADTAENLRWAMGEQKKIVTQWGNIDYRELPAQYFHFPDTVSPYVLVK